MIFLPSIANVLNFKVNVLDRHSQIAFGSIQQADVFLSTKRNMGFGEQNGDISLINIPINFINDSDVTDGNSIKNSVI
ncbi:hypothetical protein DRW41_01480 [Neobacillus piezotolerans]|uniref:Uncharacterized protein n=1 Tax=Neobacillus piezotolerans TaxID=2259171 RepID=A0A3D8GVP5_9BACI|nr:hypothetical protein [Neobacillus piezotolerans]RDU38269.1 hypothetical protein DRW41_01480 [Neobacillus piezotolerans]